MSQQENQTIASNFSWVCQALSSTEETCKLSTTCHCPACGKWFCSIHAEDEARHQCALDARDETMRECEAWKLAQHALDKTFASCMG